MKRIFLLFAFLSALTIVGMGQGSGSLTVTDNVRTCYNCRKIIFGSITVSGNTATVAGGGGSGDVVGPASATDNAVVRFDSTTGKLVQNSVVTIGDTGDVAGIVSLTFTGVLTGGSAPTTITDSTGKILSAALNDVQFANFVAAPSAGFVGATSAGDYAHRTPAQVTAALDNLVGDSGSGGTKGLVPAPASGDAAKFLKGDGTWATVSASPGGSSTQLQYNNSGAFGGISGATSDGTNVTFGSGNLLATSPAFTTSQTTTRNSIGATSTDGIVLQNTTAAAAGAQQYSPRLRQVGQGWKTSATAASQSVEYWWEVRPVQGSTNPTSLYTLNVQTNGSGAEPIFIINDTGAADGATFYYGRAWGSGNTDIYNSVVYGINGQAYQFNGTTVFQTAQGSRLDVERLLAAKASVVVGDPNTFSVGTSGTNTFVVGNGTAPTSSPADEFQLYSADSAPGDANAFARNEAGQINRLTGLSTRVSTQFDKTSDTTLANVTGLTRNVEAGRTYAFTAVLYTASNVAGGVKAAIGGTATATSIIYQAEVMDGSTLATMGTARATSLGTTVGDVTAVTAARITITGTIVVNAAGTLTVQFAQNTSNGSASSVLVNSSFQLVPIS